MFGNLRKFFAEAKEELNKVTWPDRKTTGASTVVVLVVAMIIGFYLGILDVIISQTFKYLLG